MQSKLMEIYSPGVQGAIVGTTEFPDIGDKVAKRLLSYRGPNGLRTLETTLKQAADFATGSSTENKDEWVRLELIKEKGKLLLWCRTVLADTLGDVLRYHLDCMRLEFKQQTDFVRISADCSYSLVLEEGATVRDVCLAEEFVEIGVQTPVDHEKLESFMRSDKFSELPKSHRVLQDGRVAIHFDSPFKAAKAYDQGWDARNPSRGILGIIPGRDFRDKWSE